MQVSSFSCVLVRFCHSWAPAGYIGLARVMCDCDYDDDVGDVAAADDYAGYGDGVNDDHDGDEW
eukprot:7109608-Pyramimonas_sp.AAC.2